MFHSRPRYLGQTRQTDEAYVLPVYLIAHVLFCTSPSTPPTDDPDLRDSGQWWGSQQHAEKERVHTLADLPLGTGPTAAPRLTGSLPP